MSDLARLVIKTLDAQQRYFTTRDRDDLIASKALERILRVTAEREIKKGPKQDGLFDSDPVPES